MSSDSAQKTYNKLQLLKLMVTSREGDRREGMLLRQSKGWFHVGGMGHESLAVVGDLMEADDYFFGYYRDRAINLAKGMTNEQLAKAYFAKRDSSSGGRQMPGHYSSRELNIWSVCTPTGGCLLPACGVAWAMKLQGKKNVVVGTIGDASCRQGEFYEAVALAVERQLPIVFVVEDNRYGISSNTDHVNPFRLGIFDDKIGTVMLDARHPDRVFDAAMPAIEKARQGGGPTILHCEIDRICDHTSSDDQRVYRSEEELAEMLKHDPIDLLSADLIEEGELTEDEWQQIKQDIVEQVDREYLAAQELEDPRAEEVLDHLFGPLPAPEPPPIEGGKKWRIVDALNATFQHGLETDDRYVFFGQDIEDPKGGVFGLTKGLSASFPERVFNSPLAEATIAGVACGMGCFGMHPVFEMQFIDFMGAAWSQIAQNIATIRWRSFDEWPCPTVIYAPYGAYLPGGSLWHSQANEALFAHVPGLRVVIPTTAEDAAGLMWTAMRAEDPTIFLIPKHRFRQQLEVPANLEPIEFGKAAIRREGTDVTLVTWGNCIELAYEVADQLAAECSIEVIDLRTIVPWDRKTVSESLAKTGRLVVVQEDAESCSAGQMIISEMTGNQETWESFISGPQLVSRADVHIGFNPIYEYAALPSTEDVAAAVRRTMAD